MCQDGQVRIPRGRQLRSCVTISGRLSRCSSKMVSQRCPRSLLVRLPCELRRCLLFHRSRHRRSLQFCAGLALSRCVRRDRTSSIEVRTAAALRFRSTPGGTHLQRWQGRSLRILEWMLLIFLLRVDYLSMPLAASRRTGASSSSVIPSRSFRRSTLHI